MKIKNLLHSINLKHLIEDALDIVRSDAQQRMSDPNDWIHHTNIYKSKWSFDIDSAEIDTDLIKDVHKMVSTIWRGHNTEYDLMLACRNWLRGYEVMKQYGDVP